MRNKLQILILMSLLIQLSNSCNDSTTYGQSNTDRQANGSSTTIVNQTPKETNSKAPIKQTDKKPFLGTTKLKQTLKKDSLEWKDRLVMSEKLGWKGFCSFDEEENVSDPRIWFNSLGENKYVIEVFCNSSGAYNWDYLHYYYDENNLSPHADLMSFEWFIQDENKKNYIKHVSFNPYGNFAFDEKTKLINNTFKSTGAAQCGWEANYKILGGKAVLIGMRAEWNCQPGTDFDNWKKLNLKTLRLSSKKTIYDKFDD
jgi:hypothetical protein